MYLCIWLIAAFLANVEARSILEADRNGNVSSGMDFFKESEILSTLTASDHKCDGLCSENLQKADTQCKQGQGLVPKYLSQDAYCQDCECRNDNNCSFTRGFFGGMTKKCECEAGYEEKKGVCVGTCKDNPCQNEGECAIDGQDIRCNCKAQFTGSRCEELLATCTEDEVCIGNRKCENEVCECKPGYGGNDCSDLTGCTKALLEHCVKAGATCVYAETSPFATCQCAAGYTYKDLICKELNDTAYKCEKDCKPGICYKDAGKEICICPPTHVFKDGTCKDRCTAGSMPPNMCPKDACEPNTDLGFRCKCEGLFTYDQNNVTCRRKMMCSEGNGKEECGKKNARCVEDSKLGFRCECAEAEEMDDDGICKKKCELKKYQDDCLKKLGVCEMDGSKVTCKCRPLVTSDSNGVCTELAISYSGDLSFAKSYYASKSFYAPGGTPKGSDYEKMRRDLRNAMRLMYGGSYKSANILSCSDTSTSFTCAVEIQFNSDPKDQVRLIGDDSTCISTGSDTCFIPPGLFLESKTISLDLLSQTDPCREDMKQMNCGGNKTVCNRVPDDNRNFQCSCAEGFVSYNVHYPVADTRTVIHNCEDVDECALPGACPNRTRCFNTYGSYECVCQEGYRQLTETADPKQFGCTRICGENEDCGRNQVCGDGICICKPGYGGDDCTDLLGCTKEMKELCEGVEATCVYDKNSPYATCKCKEGFVFQDSKCIKFPNKQTLGTTSGILQTAIATTDLPDTEITTPDLPGTETAITNTPDTETTPSDLPGTETTITNTPDTDSTTVIIDLCVIKPCKNGGICKMEDEKYVCYCPSPFTGKYCEMDPCSNNPCRNGGTCFVHGAGFQCICREPFAGDTCEASPCMWNPCKNGGICKLVNNSARCFCDNPYSGEFCEYVKGTALTLIMLLVISSLLVIILVLVSCTLCQRIRQPVDAPKSS